MTPSSEKVKICSWNSSSHQVGFFLENDTLSAFVQDSNGNERLFEAYQIKFGPIKSQPLTDLIERVTQLSSEFFTTFLRPKKDPEELWIIQANEAAAIDIKVGKKHLDKEEDYKKALKCFNDALEIMDESEGDDVIALQNAIQSLKKESHTALLAEIGPKYLIKEKERSDFSKLIQKSAKAKDPLKFFQTHLRRKVKPACLLLVEAYLNESAEKWEEAFNSYLKLAKQQGANTAACLTQAYLLLDKVNKSSDVRDAVRMTFEEHLRELNEMSSQTKSPTAFICFNLDQEDDDIRVWLKNFLVPDLDQVGINPLFCLRDLRKGASLTGFERLARSADLVLVACTPGLKAKCEREALVGAGFEATLIEARVNDAEKIGTTYPIYLKGSRKESLPESLIIYENTLGEKLPIAHASGFSYFCQTFDLFAAMRGVPREKGQNLRDSFLKETIKILEGNFDHHQLNTWRANREVDLTKVLKAAKERVANEAEFASLPLPATHFTGRKEELGKLHKLCQNNHRVALSGLGGIGKSALSIYYANEYKSDYKFIHFILGSSFQLISQGLLELADHLQVPKSDKPEERLLWLKNTLMNFKGKYLLLFDGVDKEEVLDELERYIPDQASCLLVTTRLTEKAELLKYKKMHLDVLSPQDAIDFLLDVTGNTDRKAAKKLAKELGYLPVALTHAAGYIRSKNLSMKRYKILFTSNKWELFKERWLTLAKDEVTIHKTWQISVDAIKEKCPSAVDLFNFFSILAHAPIPLSLVEEWYKTFFSDSSQLEAMDAIGYLIKYSLIEKAPQDYYNIHSLVQEITKSHLNVEQKEQHYAQALNALEKRFKNGDLTEREIRLTLVSSVIHAETILDNTTPSDSETEKYKNYSSLGNRIFEYYDRRREHLKAYEIVKKLLQIRKQVFAERDPSIGCSLVQLGISLRGVGRYDEALKHFQDGLELIRALLREKYPSVASIQDNMERSLGKTSRHSEVLDLIKVLLREHPPSVASTQDNVEDSIGELRRDEEGSQYFKEGLGLIRLLGVCLHHVGTSLGDLGRHEEALNYKREALEFRSALLGGMNSDIADDLGQVGITLGDLGQHEEALKYKKEALVLNRASRGEKHPSVADHLIEVGATLGKLGQHEKALNYKREALELNRALLGEEHIDVANNLIEVGISLGDLGLHKEALKNFKKAIELYRGLPEDKGLSIAIVLGHVGYSLGKLGRHEEALKNHEESLELYRALLGKKHPYVAMSLHDVGSSLFNLGRHEEALDYVKKSFELLKMIHQKSHPKITSTFIDLAGVLETLKRYNDVLDEMKNFCEFIEHHQGMNHADAIKWRIILDNTYRRFQKQS